MKLNTRLKHINFLLVHEKEIVLSGKKNYFINLPKQWLPLNFYKKFFTSPKLKDRFNDIYKKTWTETFLTKNSFKIEGMTIYYDIYSFFHSYVNDLFSNHNKNEINGFIFNKWVYIFYQEDIDSILENIIYGLSEDVYYILYKIYHNHDYHIFLGENYIKKQRRILQKEYLKSRIIKPGFVTKISSENLSKSYPIYTSHQRVDKSEFPQLFLWDEYISSHKKTIKIKKWLFHPIKGLARFQKYDSKIGIWFSGTFWINHWHYLFSDADLNYSTGFDISDSKVAKAKAFCEGIERFNSWYFSSDILWDDLLVSIDKDMSEKILWYSIPEDVLGRVHKFWVMYEIKTMNDTSIHRFKNPNKIPHELLYYPSIPEEERFYFASSNWIWAGRTYEESLMWWIFELSERDSLMLTWLLKLSPDIIDIKSLPKYLIERVEDIERIGWWRVYIYDISYDKWFPHVLVIQKKENGWHYWVWASAGFILENVIEKALSEASVSSIYWSEESEKIYSFNDVKNVKDHKIFYEQGDNCEKYLSFLFQDESRVNFQQLKNWGIKNYNIGLLLSDLTNNVGWRFYIADFTTEYSKKLGIYVTRVLSENLVPIWFWSWWKIPYLKDRLRLSKFDKWKKHKYYWDIPDFLHFFN